MSGDSENSRPEADPISPPPDTGKPVRDDPKKAPASTDPGAADFVDPMPHTGVRLSRKNILALVLTIAGVIMALFFSSRRSPEPPAPDVEVPEYDSMTPISIGDPPELPTAPAYSWTGTPSPPPVVDERRRTRYEEARHARPLLHTFSMAPEPSPEPDMPGAYILRESTVIEAALETALHSKRPGPVLARVVRPVRDSEHLHHILIPAGTKLTGTMQPQQMAGGHRIVVAWTRMEFPDGHSMALPDLPALETSGEHGLADRVNRHRARSFGSAALMALIGGTSTYATAQTGLAGSLAGASLGMELSHAASGTLQQHRSRTPTVTVRPGYRFLIYVSRDLHFDAPYP